MDSFFIPPPFPFPEVWPRVFAEQQERRWLTPTTTWSPVQWVMSATAEGYYPLDQAIPPVVTTCDDEDDGDDEEGDDGYEYGYVLSKEWQERFQSSIPLQRQANDKKKKKLQKKKIKKQSQATDTEAAGALHASRSRHLQREIQAAKMRGLARTWKHRGNVDATPTTTTSPHVEALETSLNMHFDNFCDAFQPVVWPHDSLQ